MPQSIVPNTQFGLKLPWSCLEIYHREASLQRKKTAPPLTFSPCGCPLSTQKYGWRVNYQFLIFCEGNVFVYKDKNVYPVWQFFFSFFKKNERLQICGQLPGSDVQTDAGL